MEMDDSSQSSESSLGSPAAIVKAQMAQYHSTSDDSSSDSSIEAYSHNPDVPTLKVPPPVSVPTAAKPVPRSKQPSKLPVSTPLATRKAPPPTPDVAMKYAPGHGAAPALHFPGMLPPNDFFNPTSDDGEALAYPVEALTVSCKVVEQCHPQFLSDIKPEFLPRAMKGYKGIRNVDDPSSQLYMDQDVQDS